MTKQKLFVLAIIGTLLIASFGCGKSQEKQTKEQAEKKQPEATAKLIDYEVTRRWASGMEVSIPHSSTEEQIKQLNDNLVQTYFRNTPIISIQYNCLDHPSLRPYIKKAATTTKYFYDKELVATYTRNRTTRFEELDISSPTPENRYPDIMTVEEIRKLDAEVKQKNKGSLQ